MDVIVNSAEKLLLLLSGGRSYLSRADYLAASTYYVDSVNGNDGNDGLSASTAFANLTALPTLSEGDVVGLAAGSSWEGQNIVAPANGIKVGAYGVGNAPIIDTRTAETGWTLAGGTTNVYEKSVTFTAVNVYDTSVWVNVTEDDEFLPRVANEATCDSTAGSYYISAEPSPAGLTITIGIHTTDSADPDTNGSTYYVTELSHAIDMRTRDNCIVYDVDTRYCLHKGGTIKTGEDAVIHTCSLLYGNVHNGYAEQGSTFNNCTVYGHYTTQAASYLVFNQATPTGKQLTVVDCTIGNSSTYDETVDGLYSHNNSSGEFGAVSVSNCTFRNHGVSLVFGDCGAVTVSDCTFDDVRTVVVPSYDGISYTFIDCSGTNDTGNAAQWVDGSIALTGASISMTNCSLTSSNMRNAFIFCNKNNYSFTLDNCTFSTSDSSGNRNGVWLSSVTSPGTITINNCSFGGPGLFRSLDFGSLEVGVDLTYIGDNNTFDGVFGYVLYQNGTEYASSQPKKSADWINDTGQDANSTFA